MPQRHELHPENQRTLADFELALDALTGLAAQHPKLAQRLNAIHRHCNAGFSTLELYFGFEVTDRAERMRDKQQQMQAEDDDETEDE
jgi:uncharacterized membrane protein